ncbi:MAG: sigma-70 family RNA polymerase sigma factor [Butyrivibrio sp.]|nr:sigma-70 family RNA polymerase sigma factor [Butyrivibrio sp.]
MTDIQFDAAMMKIRQGDKDGLREIYEAYIGLIYAIAKDILQSKENAEDVASEFFIKLWDKADTYQSGGGHKAWLTTIARNMAIDYQRKYKKEEKHGLIDDAEYESVKGQESDINSPVEQKVIGDAMIKEALAGLKEKERQIMNMKILGEMTFQEIAGALKLPLGTVTWRYQNAVKKLRRCGYGTGF